jgi:hypothetical protein
VITRLRALFGKKDPANEPVDLNEATHEVIALLQSELQRSRDERDLVATSPVSQEIGSSSSRSS